MDGMRRVKLEQYQADARQCVRCHEPGLVHVDATLGRATPMLGKNPSASLGILLVGEAPNWGDTYDADKGHLTYDKDTDPTGRFMWRLLTEEVRLREDEIDEILFTNAVLCLPAERDGKHRVGAAQLKTCSPWLARLIHDADVRVVVTMGGDALRAVSRVERHSLTLNDVGKLHPWYGRQLLPLYHASVLGRANRPEAEQRVDIRPLRTFLGR
jgi:uracil-DNA glycosylase